MNKSILFILLLGIVYKLIMVSNGNFLFHIDSARDWVDVREMVVLKKPRLIGAGTAIEGVFNGPAWYYILAIPFIVSGGDPFAPLVLQIIFWAVGGYFLLKIVSGWSKWLTFPIGFLWIASNYIGLSTVYIFSPNPITLLTPLFIYFLSQYLKTNKTVFAILTFLLGGIFLNLEMNFAVFIPLIIFFSFVIFKKELPLKKASFWIGLLFYLLYLLPQVIFELRHGFLISKSLMAHLQREVKPFDVSYRLQVVTSSFFDTFVPTILNRKLLAVLISAFSIPVFLKFFKDIKKDAAVVVSLCYIFVPFLGFLILPVTVNPWHLGGPMAASVILAGFTLKKLWDFNWAGKVISLILAVSIFSFSLFNIFKFFLYDRNTPNMNPSAYKNEIAAIDYVYKYAKGQNFKVYAYLPSVYDYPYQYLIWWYGLRNFGYLPLDYAYAPNKPQIISNKQYFSQTPESSKKRENSNLVFLIKEPDRNETRSGWEGGFVNLEFISKQMVGPIEVELKREK